MQIAKNTDRVDVTIKGLKVSVPAPFADGHACTANEANVLNQILRENVRNNNARSVEKAIEAAKGADKVDLKALQASIDKYIEGYEFGIRRAGGGGGRTVDPIAKEAKRLAVDIIKAACANQGLSISDVGGMTEINKLAGEYLDSDKGEAVQVRAKINVEARAETAAAGIGIKLKKQPAKPAADEDAAE